ncbi:MAG: ABC-F type ribosomal protection protein [Turicibacter sp.]|nr:ABC-F type ribosomal protection protein [Turicibacter sp.]
MELLKIKKIELEFGIRELLNIEELSLYEYDRIGLVGANGAGKSTLLRILSGEIKLPGCNRQAYGEFAYLPQLHSTTDEVLDFSLAGKLGVHQLSTTYMSGGEETRMKIAAAFSKQAHGIFADEPTSHLDSEGIAFLVNQFKSFSGAVLVISHDRSFLDQVVDKIWELENGKITEYWGNFSEYQRQKEAEKRALEAKFEQVQAQKQKLQSAVEEKLKQAQKMEKKEKSKKRQTESGGRLGHQKSTGSKQKKLHQAAKSMGKKLESMEEITVPKTQRPIRFKLSEALGLHNPYPIMGSGLTLSAGGKMLLDNVDFNVPLGAKIAITGANGTGKTSFLKMLLEGHPNLEISPKVKMGYFAQDSFKFGNDQVLMDFMEQDSDYSIPEIRQILAGMGFKNQDVKKHLSQLSGGEIIKLHLAKLLAGKYNVLLMDEPSNFLDLPSLEALETLLKNYPGTLLFVSHDSYFRERLADVVYEIRDKQLVRII